VRPAAPTLSCQSPTAAVDAATPLSGLCFPFVGGYAGYFRDPDGHLWEVAWNPADIPPDDHA